MDQKVIDTATDSDKAAVKSDEATIILDLSELNLMDLAELEGSALELIIRELETEQQEGIHARHSSHSSYSTHGTLLW